MGSPDLPNDENTLSRPLDSLPMHGIITTASDDSDNENMENLGYQPLPFDEENAEYVNREDGNDVDDNVDDEDDDYDYSTFNYPTEAPETGIVIPSIDAEIESQVWNAPRPDTSDIVLDSTRTEQVNGYFGWFVFVRVRILNSSQYNLHLFDNFFSTDTDRYDEFHSSECVYPTVGTWCLWGEVERRPIAANTPATGPTEWDALNSNSSVLYAMHCIGWLWLSFCEWNNIIEIFL